MIQSRSLFIPFLTCPSKNLLMLIRFFHENGFLAICTAICSLILIIHLAQRLRSYDRVIKRNPRIRIRALIPVNNSLDFDVLAK